jgi:tRNA-splicing ligase RtcB
MGKIREVIPVGFNHHEKNQEWGGFNRAPDIQIIKQEINSARKQLGTLGSGNHFFQLSRHSDGQIGIMLHSGSRNFGLKIAQVYHDKAKKLREQWFSNIPDKDLSFLPIETSEAKEYLAAMVYAVEFAKENRSRMIGLAMKAISDVLGNVEYGAELDIAHNYAAWESHFGQNVIVHRKGATSARQGQMGIIPGSQGTKSYMVRGKGNPESFNSCSHGAGRAMGRKIAIKTLSLENELKILNDQGIIHSVRNIEDLDEATSAYKDIEIVMANQDDLVDIVEELTPIAVIKG